MLERDAVRDRINSVLFVAAKRRIVYPKDDMQESIHIYNVDSEVLKVFKKFCKRRDESVSLHIKRYITEVYYEQQQFARKDAAKAKRKKRGGRT